MPEPKRKLMGIELPNNLYQQWKRDAGKGIWTDISMSDRLMQVVNEPDDEKVLLPNGETKRQDVILFTSEYNQQYRETLEMLLLTAEWAEINALIDSLEINNPDIEQSTNSLQRRTTGIKLLR